MENIKDFLSLVEKRKSIRSYESTAIKKEKLDYILEAFRLAPSAKNLQPWKLIVITDKAVMNALVPVCRNQAFIAEAPVIIAICVNDKEAYATMGGYLSSASIDVGISFEHLILAATEQGLASCWIGAFDEKAVGEILGLPENVRVAALTPLGYSNDLGRERRRKSVEDIVSYNKY